MPLEPIACTLLAAASLSTSVRRATQLGAAASADYPIDPLATAMAAARHRARLLHIPDSTVAAHLAEAERRGQPGLAALRDLIDRAASQNAGR